MKECPYCGNEEFFIKQSYSGINYLNVRFDGAEADNTNMYGDATHVDMTKYAYCTECKKRLFPIEDYYKSLFQ